jgi:hypothetical protein
VEAEDHPSPEAGVDEAIPATMEVVTAAIAVEAATGEGTEAVTIAGTGAVTEEGTEAATIGDMGAASGLVLDLAMPIHGLTDPTMVATPMCTHATLRPTTVMVTVARQCPD